MHSNKVSTSVSESRNRKSTKPIMEKRRRARINASLAELKSLLLEVIKKEGARHSKMEKADILEMTVKHLRDMQRQSFTAAAAIDPTIINKHRLGFSECTQEVSRYLSNIDGCDVELRTRLLDHLANFVSGTEARNSPSPSESRPVVSPCSSSPLPVHTATQPSPSSFNKEPQVSQSFQPSQMLTDINNNISVVSNSQSVQATKVMSGLQVIPTKLQTGEIAFVLPGNLQERSNVPNYVIPVYTTPTVTAVKPPVTMTTGAATPGSFMTIMPSADVLQTCTLSPGNINIISQPMSSPVSVSSPVTMSSHVSVSSPLSLSSPVSVSTASVSFSSSASPSSTSDSSMLSISPPLRPVSRDVKDVREMRHHDARDSVEMRCHDDRDLGEVRHHDVRDLGEVRHHDVRNSGDQRQQQVETTQMWRPW